MWSNYIITSLRTLKRNKLFVAINLISIAIAFSLCTIAYFNVQYNREFNENFKGAAHIYKINSTRITANGNQKQGRSPLLLGPTINNDIAGVKAGRFTRERKVLKIEEQLFSEAIAFVDNPFLEIFQLPLIEGHTLTSLEQNQVLIRQEVADRLFNGEVVPGQIINVLLEDGNKLSLTIAGVLKELPENTSFNFDLIASIDQYYNINKLSKTGWEDWIDGTFVQSENLDPLQFAASVNQYLSVQNVNNKGQEIEAYQIDNILEWPAFENSLAYSAFSGHLNPASVVGTVSSAIAVLLLACFNFINSSIAISRKRLKEIGMRKVLGGRKRDLRIQFLTESLLQMFFAIVISGIFTNFLSNAYNSMFNFEIVEWSRIDLLPFMAFAIFTWLSISFLAGMYPAFYISKFKSLEIFRNSIRFSRKNLFSKSLLVFQFLICVYNVFALIIFLQNSQYQETLDRGYEVHQSINLPLNHAEQFHPLKASLEQIPGITQVTGTGNAIGFSAPQITITHLGKAYEVASLKVGKDYLQSLKVRLKSGEFFPDNEAQAGQFVLVNEMLANSLPNDILNQWITKDSIRYNVIGILEDFNLKPIIMNNKIQPTVLFFSTEDSYHYANVSFNLGNLQAADTLIKSAWNKLFPDELYLGFPQEDVMRAVRQTNDIMLNINIFIAVLTLLISTLGLYTMVYLSIQNRIKEFGVRKVLGAPIKSILILINKEAMLVLLLASILGLIAGHFVISMLLDLIYAYHMEITLMNYVWPVLIVLAISIVAIGYRSYIAAKTNPVKLLRVE